MTIGQSGAATLVVLAKLVVVVSAAGTKNSTDLPLSTATALGADAAIWLIVGARSRRR